MRKLGYPETLTPPTIPTTAPTHRSKTSAPHTTKREAINPNTKNNDKIAGYLTPNQKENAKSSQYVDDTNPLPELTEQSTIEIPNPLEQ